jgi:RNA polymerase sigma-70 factor (ECF subfamily)
MESLTPYENVEIQESNAKIIQWMEALPKKQRQVIHLRDVEGHSYNEICDILGIDLTMVKVRLFRARKTLKEKFLKVHSYGL